jgi:hypothetical protein
MHKREMMDATGREFATIEKYRAPETDGSDEVSDAIKREIA